MQNQPQQHPPLSTLPSILHNLPPSFLTFLSSRNIPLSYFTHLPSRYIRLKPPLHLTLTPLQLSLSLQIPLSSLTQISPDFYQLPSTVNIHSSPLYTNSLIYGMDISSGWVVQALGLNKGGGNPLHHLELCCAPGNKLMYAGDIMREAGTWGSLTGVDISGGRLDVTRSLFRKYGFEGKIRLFCEDGVRFAGLTEEGGRYDRVLVDAECTHEGSLKHLKKFLKSMTSPSTASLKHTRKQKEQFQKNNSNPYCSAQLKKNNWSVEDFEERFLDKKKLENLKRLQMGLLENGWRLLKVGGEMVYSTCSFDEGQNEGIVEEFLGRRKGARLVFPFEEGGEGIPFVKGGLENTVRFNPVESNTGGMFIAKLRKEAEDEEVEEVVGEEWKDEKNEKENKEVVIEKVEQQREEKEKQKQKEKKEECQENGTEEKE